MLWKQLDPRYRRLLASGQQGEAVVVDAKEDWVKIGDSGVKPTGVFGWNVTIRVKYADGTVQDCKRYIEATTADVKDIAPGTLVPIRFDPKKRSRVEIDTNALRANRDARRSRDGSRVTHAVDEAVREAEAKLEPIDASESDS